MQSLTPAPFDDFNQLGIPEISKEDDATDDDLLDEEI